MLPSIKRVAAFTASENPIIGRRNNAFRSSPTRLSSRSIFGPFPKWNTFPIFVTIFCNLFYNYIE